MKLQSLFLSLICSLQLFALTDYSSPLNYNSSRYSNNRWSVGVNVGGHYGMHWTNSFTKAYQLGYFNGHIRYMQNNIFGWKLDAAYDNFNFTNGASNTQKLRFSIESAMNLTNVLHLNDVSNRVGLLGHYGFGYTAMWNVPYTSTSPAHVFKFNKGSVDEMGHIIMGLTPQFKVNNQLSLNADLAFLLHIRQNRQFDFANPVPTIGDGFSGYMWNWSVGATYYLGKRKKHVDWV
jgi:OOP family OmpA-OmpF porin